MVLHFWRVHFASLWTKIKHFSSLAFGYMQKHETMTQYTDGHTCVLYQV